MTTPAGNHATPAEREALAAGVCVVCGQPDDNLSTLARCWSCIRAACSAWEAKVAAERASDPGAWISDAREREAHLPAFLRVARGRRRQQISLRRTAGRRA